MKDKIAETIRLLIYKQSPKLIEKLDLEDEDTFLEPLIFSYFNEPIREVEQLEEILQGYYVNIPDDIKRDYSYNDEGVAYIPKLGYFKKDKKKSFKNIRYIPKTNIEIIPYKLNSFRNIFKNLKNNLIPYSEIIIKKELYNFYKKPLSSALSILKETIPDHYSLIENHCKKIVLFKTSPRNTNSFATMSVHGIAFLNVYQEDYDEVFFIDDIAHQTGHIIIYTLTFNKKDFFVIDETIQINKFTKKTKEYRTFYILFHALYTYYTTLICLDASYSSSRLSKKQRLEILARIGFYLIKYEVDLKNFKKIVSDVGSIDKILTKKAQTMFEPVLGSFQKFYQKYFYKIEHFLYRNQPYNFTFKDFAQENSIIL